MQTLKKTSYGISSGRRKMCLQPVCENAAGRAETFNIVHFIFLFRDFRFVYHRVVLLRICRNASNKPHEYISCTLFLCVLKRSLFASQRDQFKIEKINYFRLFQQCFCIIYQWKNMSKAQFTFFNVLRLLPFFVVVFVWSVCRMMLFQ